MHIDGVSEVAEQLAFQRIHTGGVAFLAHAAKTVDLVKEDQASFLSSGHFKKFSDHPGALSHILLDQLRADDSD